MSISASSLCCGTAADNLIQQPRNLGKRNPALCEYDFRDFAFPIAGNGLERILRAQAMFEDQPRIQSPACVCAWLCGFPGHQDSTCDMIECARHLPCAGFKRRLGGDALGEDKRPVEHMPQPIAESLRNGRGL